MPLEPDADSSLEESQLVKQAQAGSLEAFGLLYERFAPQAYRFIYAHLGNQQDAEDLVEEVFLRVWRSLPQYQERGIPFRAFVMRVARNALIDSYRSVARMEQPLALEENVPIDTKPNPEDVAQQRQEVEEIRKVIFQLPKDYRTVVTLRFLANLSPEETALVMGKSPGAVRVMQHRALEALRKLLK
jgi:RNA polymerase sigma-70 factor (ECF subfamily)